MVKQIITIIGHFTKTEYTVYTFEDGAIEAYLAWPEIPWRNQDQLICSGDSVDEVAKKIQKREDLIQSGDTVL